MNYWNLVSEVHWAIAEANLNNPVNIHYHVEQANHAWDKSIDFIMYLKWCDKQS